VWAVNLKNHENTSFFAIFDGHGGCKTAEYMSQNILQKFEALENVFDEKAITALCLAIDREYLEYCNDTKELIGTTGVFHVCNFFPSCSLYQYSFLVFLTCYSLLL
jgi:serine/threonine protein phosphatase PrpC